MADGFIVRKGGVTTEQALAPTITEVSTTQTSITFTITNNDASTAVILYEVGDTTPDANSIELAASATSSNLTISGLSPGTVDLYATANVTGKVKSNVTEREFTIVNPFTAATGGTTLEYDSGGKRFKSHTFTSDGTFTVTNVGTTTDDRNKVDYLIIAGGGGGGDGLFQSGEGRGGGGGAGGFRTTVGTQGGLGNLGAKVVVTAQAHSIDVGSGGTINNSGDNSSALGITSTGGGNGSLLLGVAGGNGGSGGGGTGSDGTSATQSAGGTGTTNQGFNGGTGNTGSSVARAAGGGGGAGAVGSNGSTGNNTVGANGGNGLNNLIRTGSNEIRAGGGGGGGSANLQSTGGTGGGGAGSGTANIDGGNGTANTGSGAGGGPASTNANAGNGGNGIVVIRYEIAPSV